MNYDLEEGQPIETAPANKDLLVFMRHGYSFLRFQVGSYRIDASGRRCWFFGARSADSDEIPVRWWHLPPLPLL